MSIVIKDMEMPASRGEYMLRLYVYSDRTATVEGAYSLLKGEPFEAVPVPPHGRLIDADALDDVCVRLNADNWRITVGEHKLLDRVLFEFPTILEAEVGET